MFNLSKKLSISAILFVFIGLSFSQAQTKSDIFKANEITWYGVDFTKAKLVGSFSQFSNAGTKDGDDIKSKYFPGWNSVVVSEPKKYTLDKFFHVNYVPINMELVSKFNAEVDAGKLISMNSVSNSLSDEDLQNVSRNYANKGKGIGVLFVVELFDKYQELGVIDVVYFQESTGNVLFSKRLTGKAQGFGLRNYWAASIYNVFLGVKKDWKRWAKEAGK
ncbi:MAG: hypothetical protein K2Q22_13150 [Cytophagales bacterium]|nr:hypothetical protein [Cytophagales bacterium]